MTTPTRINSDVPPKNCEKACCTSKSPARAGMIAMKAINKDPGNVRRDMTVSMYSAVSFPGFIPGMNPLLRFMSSAICLAFSVIAV